MVIKKLNSGDDGPVDDDEIQASSGVAHFFFHPFDRMTWAMVCFHHREDCQMVATDFRMRVDWDYCSWSVGFCDAVGVCGLW